MRLAPCLYTVRHFLSAVLLVAGVAGGATPAFAQAHDPPTAARVAPARGCPRGDARPAGYRCPATARTLAILYPAAGHIYAGDLRGAWLVWNGTFVPPVAMMLLYYSSDSPFLERHATPIIGAAALVTLSALTYGIIDAPRAARRSNARRGFGLLPAGAAPRLGFVAGPAGEAGVALSLPLPR